MEEWRSGVVVAELLLRLGVTVGPAHVPGEGEGGRARQGKKEFVKEE